MDSHSLLPSPFMDLARSPYEVVENTKGEMEFEKALAGFVLQAVGGSRVQVSSFLSHQPSSGLTID